MINLSIKKDFLEKISFFQKEVDNAKEGYYRVCREGT